MDTRDDKNITKEPEDIDVIAKPAGATTQVPPATPAAPPPGAPHSTAGYRPQYRPVGLPPWGEP
jgi:hypothetical protein